MALFSIFRGDKEKSLIQDKVNEIMASLKEINGKEIHPTTKIKILEVVSKEVWSQLKNRKLEVEQELCAINEVEALANEIFKIENLEQKSST